jgi:hypothetical protein
MGIAVRTDEIPPAAAPGTDSVNPLDVRTAVVTVDAEAFLKRAKAGKMNPASPVGPV